MCVQREMPTVLVSVRFLQGGYTFVGLTAVPSVHHKVSSTAASLSQQARLPQRLQAVFSEFSTLDVHLPRGVSRADASTTQYFSSAHQHRVSAGFWTRNSCLDRVLQLLLQQ